MRTNQIIAQVEQSDRNIYLTIMDGALVAVNYSQGVGEIDSRFFEIENSELTEFVREKINYLGGDEYQADFFFPSPYWGEQIEVIDDAISKFFTLKQRNKNRRVEVKARVVYHKLASVVVFVPETVPDKNVSDYLYQNPHEYMGRLDDELGSEHILTRGSGLDITGMSNAFGDREIIFEIQRDGVVTERDSL